MSRPAHHFLSRSAALVSSAAALAVITSAGCARTDRTPAADTTMAATPAPDTTSSAAAPMLNDAQIAHIAVTANSIDSTFGVLAKSKGKSKSIKDFAQSMIVDHGAVNKQAGALAQRLNLTPESNPVSTELQQAADQARSGMEGQSGAAFDRAYIDREVTYHQAVLDALDQKLIPGAQNPDLKKLLQDARPNFAAHLARAKSIQSSLGTT